MSDFLGLDWGATNWDDMVEPGRQDRIKGERAERAATTAARNAPLPEFTYPEFKYPEFDSEDIGFTERKKAPLDFSGLARQAGQKQAVTGIEPSADFISGIARPMLETAAKENVMLTELEMKRKREAEGFAFDKYKFGRTEEFAEYGADKATAFEKHKFDIEAALKKEDQRIAEMQARNSKQDDGKIICTELNRQGLLPNHILLLDREHRRKYIDDRAQAGYIMLATPIVKLMKKSKLFTQLIRPFAKGFAYESASRIDANIKGSCIGKIILQVGVPICRFYYNIKVRATAQEVV